MVQVAERNSKFGENITAKFDIDLILKNIDNELSSVPPVYTVNSLKNSKKKIFIYFNNQSQKMPMAR